MPTFNFFQFSHFFASFTNFRGKPGVRAEASERKQFTPGIRTEENEGHPIFGKMTLAKTCFTLVVLFNFSFFPL